MSKGNGHKTETPDVSHIRNVEVTHEASDINVSGVLTFVVALTVMTIGVYLGMLGLFNYFQSQEAKEPQPGPMALRDEELLPPEPRLQSAPGFSVTLENGKTVKLELTQPQEEYVVLKKQWEESLKGQLKDSSGNAGIPIEEAMKKIGSEGLPTRATTGTPGKLSDYAISVPTAASSGRVSEKRIQ
jgi:hypothetical protein